ncbi:MAG: hypothetical protein JSR26_02950 [Proteobacteria bacterium]|nr:hypothetical protein [Pseudomonadota bacterium]
MRNLRPVWSAALLPLLLAGCMGGGQVRNIFPPRASIQQLTVQPDGHWKLQLRAQNYSNVSTTFARIDARVEVAGQLAGNVSVSPNLRVGPESADVAEVALVPSPAIARSLSLPTVGNIAYKLSGTIVTSDPKGEYKYSFEGQLSPVPGLPGVLR